MAEPEVRLLRVVGGWLLITPDVVRDQDRDRYFEIGMRRIEQGDRGEPMIIPIDQVITRIDDDDQDWSTMIR